MFWNSKNHKSNYFKKKGKIKMTIKEAREKAGLTQATMSEKMEIPKRTIEDWERGVRVPPKYVERLIIAELERIAGKNS